MGQPSQSASAETGVQKHVPELDGIRGLAILMVLFWHYYCGQLPRALATSGWTGVLIRAASSFWSGVDLFFVLSGFLIGGILIDNRDVLNLYKVFYIRRACRILPVCVLTLAAFFTLRPVLDPDRTTWLFRHAMPDWSYLTFTQNIVMGIRNSFGAHFLGITWSLAIEEQFYLFLPFLLFVLGYRRMVLILAPLVIGAIMLRLLFPGFGAFVNMPFRMDALILGVILAVAVRHPPVVRLLRENRVRLRIVVGILGAAWILVTATQPALGAFKGSFYAAVYAGLILLVVLETGQGWCAPLRSRPLRFCGTISYGLYMYHQAVTGLLHAFICKSKPLLIRPLAWGVTALSVVVVFLLAALSFYYFEQRFLRWGHGFKYSRAASLPDGRRLVDDFRPEAGGGHDG